MGASRCRIDRIRALSRLFAQLFSLPLLLVLTGSHTLPALHFAVVAHEICAEHGELHHVDTGEADDAAGGAESVDATARSIPLPSEHAHEHCAVLALGSERVVLEHGYHAERPVSAPLSGAFALVEAGTKSSVALLSYAPKLAPPV